MISFRKIVKETIAILEILQWPSIRLLKVVAMLTIALEMLRAQ